MFPFSLSLFSLDMQSSYGQRQNRNCRDLYLSEFYFKIPISFFSEFPFIWKEETEQGEALFSPSFSLLVTFGNLSIPDPI
jgi:hypothetical protein